MTGAISRRELELIMKMDDQTKREREALNRSLGAIEKTADRSSKEARRSIVEIAKQSKQSMEGIKAVMEIGGWLAMANMVGGAFMKITEEARKNSAAFKEAGAALDVMGSKLGTGLVKAMEPLAQGFTQVLRYGTAVFQNFPEVAIATFDFVKKIIIRTFSWEGISGVFTALGKGIFSVFATSFQYIPKIFMEILGLLFSPIAALGQYIIDTIKNALTGKKIEDPFTFMGKQMGTQMDRIAGLAGTFAQVIGDQVKNFGDTAVAVAAVYGKETADYMAKVNAITAKSLAEFDAGVAGVVSPENYSVDTGVQQGPANREDPLLKSIMAFRPMTYAEQVAAIREGNLAGKNGVGAAVGENLAGTEVMSSFGKDGPLATVFAMFGQFAGTLGPLLQLLNPLQTIFGAMTEVLGPLIDNLLAPLVGMFKILGNTIGRVLAPALEILRPVIEAISVIFLALYNYVIKPVANVIIILFNTLYNVFAGFVNVIVSGINAALGWAGVHLSGMEYRDLGAGTLQDINMSDVNSAGSSNGTSSSTASYAAGMSITIEKIEIKADFIAGDAGLQDVAVMLRDKLTEAEKAGR